MVIDLRALSIKQIDFSVLPLLDSATCRYRQTNNEKNNLNYRRHYNSLNSLHDPNSRALTSA